MSPRKSGYTPPNSVLSAEDVVKIRARLKAGESARQIAPDYHISPEAVRRIDRRESWAHLP